MEWQSKTGCKTGIYKIFNTVTGCVYIGQASDELEGRYVDHKQALRWGNHGIVKLQEDWNKYGQAAFVFSVELFVENENAEFQEMLDREETRLIKSYPFRYNTRVGGSGKRNYDEAARSRLSEAAINKKMTKEQRELRNQRHRITVAESETQTRIGNQTKKRWADPEQRAYLLSVTQTPEINEIRSAASREYWSDPAVRKAQTEKNYKMHSNPKFKEQHRAAVTAAHNAPGGFEKYSKGAENGWIKRKADPEYAAKQEARARKISETKQRRKAEKLMQLSSSVSSDTSQSQQ